MSEVKAVQEPMIKYAGEIGWEYVSEHDALRMRGGESGLFFTEVLEEMLLRLNPGILDLEGAQEVIRKLNLLDPSITGNQGIMTWIKGEGSVFDEEENRERNVRLIDFDDIGSNIFQVSEEWTHTNPGKSNRADVVFLVNGIPLAVAELKAPKRGGLEKGIQQIRRYHNQTPEMMLAPQLFEVTHMVDFFYGATWSTSRKGLFNWKDVEAGSYESKVKAFFEQSRFLRVIRDYVVFVTVEDELKKMILRQHQMRATEKVLERCVDQQKKRGLVWHTQGSGKSLTMMTIASRLLRETPGNEKPTVLMIVDRNELEGQLFKNVSAYGLAVETARSKRHLADLLRSDTRGLIISMIHKFDDIPELLNQRESIFVLVDEAHRSTGGDLGNYLLAALPNATFIGFTGTPIDKLAKGQGTFKTFGPEDPQGYLDKYSIRESVEDGTTLRLNYALAPSDLMANSELLESEFLSLAESEGVSDIDELNAILDRAVNLKEMMKSPERVDLIAKEVAKHFTEVIDPLKFKAFLVAVDREACALYKAALDKYLDPATSQVVYSSAHGDENQLRQYALSKDEERKVRKAFIKKGTDPRILIVTEKLLTGYDAPILYCMYLDKPMRDHVLLQAIARVNRPYEDDEGLVKPYGFVLDFVGIFSRLEKALSFDADVVASTVQNIDVLKQLFQKMMEGEAKNHLAVCPLRDDKDRENAITTYLDRKVREQFFKWFRDLSSLYEIISPDPCLRLFIDDYRALAELYSLLKAAYSDRPYVDAELTAKTKELVRQNSTVENFDPAMSVREIGADELKALKEEDTGDATKILNLRKIFSRARDEEGEANPILVNISERADALINAWEDGQRSTQDTLDAFDELIREYEESKKESEALGLDRNGFAILQKLRQTDDAFDAKSAKEVSDLVGRYPDHKWDQAQERDLRTHLYKLLQPQCGTKEAVALVKALLKLPRV